MAIRGLKVGTFRRTIEATLMPIELLARSSEDKLSAFPPIFIVGAPRCGSTLLYQLMLQAFRLGYISNLMAEFPRILISIAHLQNLRSSQNKPLSYQSHFGRTTGLRGPSEAGSLWYLWFPSGTDIYAGKDQLTLDAQKQVRQSIAALTSYFGSSVLLKNLYNSMRIPAISQIFPEAIFLIVQRPLLQIGQSLYLGRLKEKGDPNLWWSVPPKEYDEIFEAPPAGQVIYQPYYIYEQIKKDLEVTRTERVYSLGYSAFCSAPRDELKKMRDFLQSLGVTNELDVSNIPRTFSQNSSIRVPQDVYDGMLRTFESLPEKDHYE